MKTLLSLTALAAALCAAPAAAQEPVSANRILVVRSADLDLTSPAGVSALDRRIRAAVRFACGPTSDADLHGKNAVRQCRADTLASLAGQRENAIAQQSAPTLLASQ
jgi:UrcA family protein